MNNFGTTIKKFILFVGDFLILEGSLMLTLLIRYRGGFNYYIWDVHFLPFIFIYLFWLIIFFIHDLYELRTASNKPYFYQALIRAYLFSAGLTILIFYFFPQLIIAPKINLFINIIISFGFIYAWRNLYNKIIGSTRFQEKIAIIGVNKESLNLAQHLLEKPQLGYQIVALIDENGPFETNLEARVKIVRGLENLETLVRRENIKTLIISSDIHKSDELQKTLFKILALKINFVDLPLFYETILGRVPLNAINHIWFLENLTSHKKTSYKIIKRALDLILGIIGFIIAVPLSPLIALFIKLDTNGPIIFKQMRTGKNDKAFLAIKFRSMYVDAEKHGPQWAKKNDPRVTRVGKFLRKTRLDEIPQLLNILRGEMSFVGPRPERPEFIEELEKEIPFYRQRLLIKPGLTGWAQIEGPSYGGSKQESLEKLQYDLYYIKNYSPLLDLSIVLKTINIILKFKGQA